MKSIASFETLLQVPLADPRAGCCIVVSGMNYDIVPTSGRFLLEFFQKSSLFRSDTEYEMAGLDQVMRLHWDSMYCLMTSADTFPVVAQKYDPDQICPFFFSSGNLAAWVEPTPPLIVPASEDGDGRGGAESER